MNNFRKLQFAVAGDSRESVESCCGKDVWHVLVDNGFVERTSIRCVGFWRDINSNRLIVVLPKAFGTSESKRRLEEPSYKREQIYRLIRIFKKIRNESKFKLDGGVSNKMLERYQQSIDPVLDSFDAALRLRRYYLENGLYIRKSTRSINDAPNLPLDWSRTIRQSSTILDESDIFFHGTFHHMRRRDLKNPLALLQIACLKEIFTLTGERNGFDDSDGLDPKAFQRLKSNPQRLLRDLRAWTYDEQGRYLLNAIGAFLGEGRLASAPLKVHEELLTYSWDFELIWEKILRDLLAPNLHHRTLPTGRWYTWPDGAPDKGIQPEFDIRLSNEEHDIIIDAKDYRLFNGSKWLGSSSDHYKQIIYRELLEMPSDTYFANILAFPVLGQKNLFAIRGCHHWKEIQDSYVFEVTVDYELAVKSWLREISLNIQVELSQLLRQLQDFRKMLGSKN